MSKTAKQRVGTLGEDIAARFLEDRGFEIVDRNFRRPYGEIDIVARKKRRIHFVEVKTLSVSNGTGFVRPEEHMDTGKIHRFARIVRAYVEIRSLGEAEWQHDLVAVELDVGSCVATCRYLQNIH